MNKLKNKKAAVEKEAKSSPSATTSKARMPRAFLNVLNGTFLTRENVLGTALHPFLFSADDQLHRLWLPYGAHRAQP